MTARAVFAIGLGLVMTAFAGSFVYDQATMKTAVVASGTVTERVVARGAIVAKDGVSHVRARADGRVLAVYVHEGDHVAEGQLLAELDADLLTSEVEQRDAEGRAAAASARAMASGSRPEEIAAQAADLRAMQKEAENAQQRADREAKLLASGSVSQSANDDAQRDAQVAKARADAAAARLRLARAGARKDDVVSAKEHARAAEAAKSFAEHQLEYTRLVAPRAGTVLARRIDPGDTVAAFAGASMPALFEIADTTQTEVRVEVEEIDGPRVDVGLPVTIRIVGGDVIGHGHVARASAQCEPRAVGGDPSTARADGLVRAVWVAWDGPAPALPAGQRVEASIELTPRAVAARAPRAAVTVKNGHAVVKVRAPGGYLARERDVTLGASDPDFVEVRGVAPGTKVVILR